MIDKLYNKDFINKLFIIYIMLIIIFVLIKPDRDIVDRVNDTFSRQSRGDFKINTIPFRTIKSSINNFSMYKIGAITLILNIIAFIPFGFLVPVVFLNESIKTKNWIFVFFSTIYISVSAIVLIEFLQLITGLGSLDIDDVILNSIGVIIGFIIFLFFNIKKES